MRLTPTEAIELARAAALRSGASTPVADSLARAVVAAEQAGKAAVGFAHLIDYLDGFQAGRIDGQAEPDISLPRAAAIQVDARRGIAQLGFDRCFDQLVRRARACGVAVFSQHNSFTVGELGYYTRRLAEGGLVALAASNAMAQVATPDSGRAVFGTNPLSFAAPTQHGPALVIDQASSATAFVQLRQAAAAGESIPPGWAIDATGQPTTCAADALAGLLLAFGGARGANIALMVEVLAAGLTGGRWSIDSPPYASGAQSPAVGLFITAIDPDALAPGFAERLTQQLDRLALKGVHIPGRPPGLSDLDLPDALAARVHRWGREEAP